MRLNNTFAALNNSIVNQKETNKSLNKLSSGLRINKASDDASGLAIADKLRTHASGIKQSISNANSAVALLQITDKAMDEISNILDIVKTKLIQAHTHTTSDKGREAIKKDIEKLLSQIDNISSQTTYNGINLLAHGGLDFHVGNTETDIVSVSDIHTSLDGLSGIKYKDNSNFNPASLVNYQDVSTFSNSIPYTKDNLTDEQYDSQATTYFDDILRNEISISSEYYKVLDFSVGINKSNFQDIYPLDTTVNNYTDIFISQDSTIFAKDEATIDYFDRIYNLNIVGIDITKGTDPTLGDYYHFNLGFSTANHSLETEFNEERTLNFSYVSEGSIRNIGFHNAIINSINAKMEKYEYNNPGFTITNIINPDTNEFEVGNNWWADLNNLTQVDPNASGLCGSLKDLQTIPSSSFTFECAGNFQEVVDYSLDLLNKYRSEVGSTQIQIESTNRNLMTNYVNTKNAESIIRDVDYAQESANFSKLNVIGQGGSFAQTKQNETQQRVLELLK